MSGEERIEAVGRALRLLDHLWDGFAEGLAPSEIARLAEESPSYVTRVMATFEACGWAERDPVSSRWRPSMRVARRARQVAASLDIAQARIDELGRRFKTPV